MFVPADTDVTRSTAEELADIIMVLQRCFMMNLSKELNRGQVSFAQFFLLAYMKSQGAMSMSQIAERMSHTTAAATGLVDRLERLGYVSRTHAKHDRRKVMVRTTKKGLQLVERIREDIIQNLTEVLELLPQEDRHAWLRVYRRVFEYCQSKQE